MSRVEVLADSKLQGSAESIWARIASPEGINHELAPWMRMTAPPGTELSPAAVPVGERWFRSWILLFGVLPVDYDELCVERLDVGHSFLERSKMLSAPVWEHERTLEPLDGGRTRLVDRVSFVPRIRWTASIHRAVIAAIFRHRHRRLRAYFGAR